MDSTPPDRGAELATSPHCSQSVIDSIETAPTMVNAPTIGHKRNHSAVDSESAFSQAPASKKVVRLTPRVLLVHLTALTTCDESALRVIPDIMAEVLPESDIPKFTDEELLRAFSKSPILQHIFLELGARAMTPEEVVHLEQVYWRVIHNAGAPLITLAPGAKELLEAIKRQGGIALAVMAHNTVEAARVLATVGAGHLVDTILPALPTGIHLNEATAAAFFLDHWDQFVVPWFTTFCREAALPTTNPNGDGANNPDKTMDTTAANNNDNNANGTPTAGNEGTTTTTTTPADPEDCPIDPRLTSPEALDQLKPLVPEQALAVSSVLHDLSTARAGGLQTCWFRRVGAADALAVRASGSLDLVVEGLGELRVRLLGEGYVAVAREDKDEGKGEDKEEDEEELKVMRGGGSRGGCQDEASDGDQVMTDAADGQAEGARPSHADAARD